MNTIKVRLSQLIATLFYVGYVPYAPGTAASFVTTVVAYACCFSQLFWGYAITLLFILFVIGCLGAHFFITLSPSADGNDDPRIIVIDEVFGMLLTLVNLPHNVLWYGAAFMLFRLFDIAKPFPISFCEQRVRGYLGIMLDDFLAGLCARLVLWAAVLLY